MRKTVIGLKAFAAGDFFLLEGGIWEKKFKRKEERKFKRKEERNFNDEK